MKKALPLVLVLLAVGCKAGLNVEKVAELGVGESKLYTVDAISKPQTINVSAKATSGKFTILVVLEKDLAEAERAVVMGKASDKILASQFKTDDASLSAPIPANAAAVVLVAAADGKKAEVKLKISN